jgi:hypothetical protein
LRLATRTLPWYDTADKQARIAYQGNAMVSVLNVVSQTQMVATFIATRRFVPGEIAGPAIHLQR